MQEKHIQRYEIMQEIIERGGFLMICLIRLSALPSHFTTPLFASTDSVKFTRWLLAAVITSFRGLPPIIVGKLLKNEREDKRISSIVLIVTVAITILTVSYIYWEYRKVKEKYETAGYELHTDIESNEDGTKAPDTPPSEIGYEDINPILSESSSEDETDHADTHNRGE